MRLNFFLKQLALVVLFSLLWSRSVVAAPSYKLSGETWSRFHNNLERRDEKKTNFETWIRLNQSVRITAQDSFIAELYAYGGDRRSLLYQSLDGPIPRAALAEVWPGDFYFQKTVGAHLLRFGYQTVLWQEGIGFSYTNFINARDFRNSPFDSNQWLQRSAPMLNWLWSSSSVSVQLLYLTTSQQDVAWPFSRNGVNSPFLSQFNQVQIEDQSKKNQGGEAGGRVSFSGEGFDLSVFAFSLYDRNPYYEVSSRSTLTSLFLETDQKRREVWGGSGSFEWGGSMIRFEALQWQKRDFNQLSGNQLNRYESKDTALSLILDSPTDRDWSYSLQYSQSTLDRNPVGSLRETQESFTTLAFFYDLKSSRKLEATLLHFNHDQSLFSRLSYLWSVARNVDASFSWDTRSGPTNSLGRSQKDLSSLFLQVRTVF